MLHVTTVPQSLAFLRGQVAHLKGQGFEVHALSSPGGPLDRFGAEHQVAVHAVPMRRQISPLRDVVSLWRLGRVLRRVRPDVVHAHTPKGGLLAMLAAWLTRAPLRIYHIHGLPLMTARGPRRFLLRWSEKMACALAHHVLCVSSSVRLVAVEEGLCRPDKIEVLLHGSIDGVDAEKSFNPTRLEPAVRSAVRSQHGIPQDAVVIGFVGRIVRDKGIVELARAWQVLAAEAPTLHLLLVGNVEPQDPLPEEVERLLRSSPRIHWAGVVQEMAPLYLAMDVVVLPSYREGFGVVSLEAAAMELPVVATRIPGCVDAVRHEETGTLVPPYDAPALAEAVRAYVQDAQLRRRHGQAGRRRALQDFQPAAMSQAVAELYTRLLAVPAPSFYQRRGKRWLDVVLASLALLVLWPVLLAAALLVWLTLGAPVFFRQRRSGRHGRPFTVLKLRTMRDEWDSSGRRAPDKQRLTRLGRFLRATSIDELPELFNILKGDMSLVGPRPLMPRYLPWYSAHERRRFDCLPGLTGWAQINGRNALGWDQRLALDAWYVGACSLGLDLEILVRTVFKVLRRENVYVDSSRVLRSLDEERREALGQPTSLQRSEQTELSDGRASPLLGFSKEG